MKDRNDNSMDDIYKRTVSAEREFVSQFEHVAQLTDREVDARFDYYMGRGDTE